MKKEMSYIHITYIALKDRNTKEKRKKNINMYAKGFNALINIKYIYQCIKYMYKKYIHIYIFK